MTDCKFHLLPVLFKLNTASAPGQGRRSERESTLGGNKNKKLSFESTELGGHKDYRLPPPGSCHLLKKIEVF